MSGPSRPRLEPRDFVSLGGFADDDALAAFRCFLISARAVTAGRPEARTARPPSAGLLRAAGAALAARVADAAGARAFFERWFRPYRVVPADGGGFLTGYYEPVVPGSRVETSEFGWPLIARPDDLVSFAPGEAPAHLPPA